MTDFLSTIIAQKLRYRIIPYYSISASKSQVFWLRLREYKFLSEQHAFFSLEKVAVE
jgi:hypothetical protein